LALQRVVGSNMGQLWQEFRIEEDFCAAADARLPSDEASAFERERHLVN